MCGVSFPMSGEGRPRAIPPWNVVLRDAAMVVVICGAIGSMLNIIRSDGIPFIQREEYQILVPCPETSGEVTSVTPDDPRLKDTRVLVIDARSADRFRQFHLMRAINIPFDYLEPTHPDVIRRVASSGAREVVVYGDGNNPDSGEQLARELSGKGIRQVSFVSGGAPAIMAHRKKGGVP